MENSAAVIFAVAKSELQKHERVNTVFDKKDVSSVKRDIERFLGSKVMLESNKGRHKSTINEGIISHVYPCIFTVQLFEGKEPSRKLSFSYTDVLTNTVQITLCD